MQWTVRVLTKSDSITKLVKTHPSRKLAAEVVSSYQKAYVFKDSNIREYRVYISG